MTKKMAAGGRASSFRDMTAGSGSGLGRLQKTSIAAKTKAQKLKAGGMADGGLSKADVLAMTGKYGAPADDNGRRDAAMKAYQARQDAAELAAKMPRPRKKPKRYVTDDTSFKTKESIRNAMGDMNDYFSKRGTTDLEAPLSSPISPYNSQSPYASSGMKRGGMTKMAKGGMAEAFEGTAADMAQDKKLAKKRGMSLKDWEKSSADEKHDAQRSMKGMKMGGKAKMASGGMSTAMDGMKKPLRPQASGMAKMAKGGKAMAHEKGCKCMACGGMAKYAKGGKVTFGSMKPLPGTKTMSYNMMPEVAPGNSVKPLGSKAGGPKASGAKASNMMKPLGMTKMASGGKVRGAGIAQRGTKFIGEV